MVNYSIFVIDFVVFEVEDDDVELVVMFVRNCRGGKSGGI